MTSTSRNKGKNNNSNNNNNNNNNKRNTSNTKSQPKTHYVFGDVVFVVRRIAGLMDQALYHHAGIGMLIANSLSLLIFRSHRSIGWRNNSDSSF